MFLPFPSLVLTVPSPPKGTLSFQREVFTILNTFINLIKAYYYVWEIFIQSTFSHTSVSRLERTLKVVNLSAALIRSPQNTDQNQGVLTLK